MGLDRFAIIINPNPSGVNYAGQVVSGHVEIWNKIPQKFEGSSLSFVGKAKVRFTHRHGAGKDRHNDHLFASESYYDLKQPIVSAQSFELSAGKHEFPFSFVLPVEIPSSFEGTHGHVRHKIKAVLKRSLFKGDVKETILLPVSSIVAPSQKLEAMVTLEKKSKVKERTLGSGQIDVTAAIDRSGYYTGETIIFNAKIINNSSKPCKESSVQLIQKISYHVRHRSHIHVERRVLWEHKQADILQSETHLWDNVPFLIPQLPPSGLPFCNLIVISYKLKLIVNPGTFSSNITQSLHFSLGSVPPGSQILQLPSK